MMRNLVDYFVGGFRAIEDIIERVHGLEGRAWRWKRDKLWEAEPVGSTAVWILEFSIYERTARTVGHEFTTPRALDATIHGTRTTLYSRTQKFSLGLMS